MRNRVRILLSVLLLFAIGTLAWDWQDLFRPEPVYAGKRLSLWLAQGPSAFDDGADKFLRENVSTVTAYLITALRKRGDSLWQAHQWLMQHMPVWMVERIPQWMEPRLVRTGATYWLAQLGPLGKTAIPDLRQVGSRDYFPEVRQNALWALGRIDSGSEENVALLVAVLASESDAATRRVAAGVLEMWAPVNPVVISALNHCLEDADASVRQISAAALGGYGTRAAAALPALERLAASDDLAADYALRAARQIQGSAQ